MKGIDSRISEAELFDAWASGYDADVRETDSRDDYPFAGYGRVQEGLLSRARVFGPGRVLDLGIGTGLLSAQLAQAGYSITGVDISGEMLKLARERIPAARLIQADFSERLPREIAGERFDLILSSYAFHHVPGWRKVAALQELLGHLEGRGLILIGDIAFMSGALLEACRASYRDAWDASEDYLVYEDLECFFREGQLVFEAVSFCAGIISLKPAEALAA